MKIIGLPSSEPGREIVGRYWEAKGGSRRAPVFCVHGLARNSHDFNQLADLIHLDRNVYSLDMAGRGASPPLEKVEEYGYPTYLADCLAAIASRGKTEIDWVGTSMGGLIGMMLAAGPLKGTIRRLVINDAGPFIPKAALQRIVAYLAPPKPRFSTREAIGAHLRKTYFPFGIEKDQDWEDLIDTSILRLPEGEWTLHYDEAICEALQRAPIEDVDLWSVWDAVECPVLIIRGAESDLLSRETADAMVERADHVELVEVPGCGHAPALLGLERLQPIVDFLDADP